MGFAPELHGFISGRVRQTQCKVDVTKTPQHEQLFVMSWRCFSRKAHIGADACFLPCVVLCALKNPVGAGLLAKAECQAALML
ncbi:hypothetical protein, partial [Pseudomonas sp. BF-B-30]|uniref:hypothetical protein n=1 Tax=Pseudomonas sp. BF-B-30 TaxID=2832388 RepID=UPI001CBDE1D0